MASSSEGHLLARQDEGCRRNSGVMVWSMRVILEYSCQSGLIVVCTGLYKVVFKHGVVYESHLRIQSSKWSDSGMYRTL